MFLSPPQQTFAVFVVVIFEFITVQVHCAPAGLGNNQCPSGVIELYSNCTKSKYWDFKVLGDKQKDLKSFLCGSKDVLGCLNVTTTVRKQGCDVKSGDEGLSIETKEALLQSVCTDDKKTGQKCIEILSSAYSLLNASKSNGKTLQFPDKTSQSIGCCLHLVQDCYNLSKTSLEPMPQMLIKQLGRPLHEMCSFQIQPTASILPTQGTSSSTKTKVTKPKKTLEIPPKTMSSRLVAGLVIASIIFLVVSFIMVKFIYQKIQRKKRAKYEDYGYSQLKVILDDALDEEEDDDQLLSVT